MGSEFQYNSRQYCVNFGQEKLNVTLTKHQFEFNSIEILFEFIQYKSVSISLAFVKDQLGNDHVRIGKYQLNIG